MNHQTHVWLVYTHTEGVGGDDHPQLATDEAPLNILLGLRRQSCMEVARCHSLCLQELRDLFGLPPRRAVNDGAAPIVRGQICLYDLVDVGELSLAARRHHHEFQIGTSGATVEHPEIDIELLVEVVHDLRP